VTALFLTAMCLSGIGLWRWLARRGLHPLGENETSRHGLALFLAMILLANVSALAAGARAGGEESLLDASLQDILFVQALTYGLAILAVLAVASRFGITMKSLGLRARAGPPAAALAVAGWLACYPLLVLTSLLNQALVPADSEHLQDHLKRFLTEDGAASDPFVWLCIVVVLPITEEIIFRGALYGGLRRMVPPWLAMGCAGILFGLMHDGASVLPVATLGILLAWTYERTGSLKVPCLLHGLHNGFTLAVAAYLPENAL